MLLIPFIKPIIRTTKQKGANKMQKLSRKQFDVLEALATSKTALTQRQMEDKVNYSLGTKPEARF